MCKCVLLAKYFQKKNVYLYFKSNVFFFEKFKRNTYIVSVVFEKTSTTLMSQLEAKCEMSYERKKTTNTVEQHKGTSYNICRLALLMYLCVFLYVDIWSLLSKTFTF